MFVQNLLKNLLNNIMMIIMYKIEMEKTEKKTICIFMSININFTKFQNKYWKSHLYILIRQLRNILLLFFCMYTKKCVDNSYWKMIRCYECPTSCYKFFLIFLARVSNFKWFIYEKKKSIITKCNKYYNKNCSKKVK